MNLKIVSYNIHKGMSVAGQRSVLAEIREQIRATDADLVFAQEVQGEDRKQSRILREWPSESQFEFLADAMWPHTAYGKNAIYRRGHHGNAILSRLPFSSWENINVSRLKLASRSILHGVVQVEAWRTPLHVFCVHFGLVNRERRRQVEALAQRINDSVPANEPLIVAGDFNDFFNDVERLFPEEVGLRNAFVDLWGVPAKTFPAFFPVLPLDRIYYRGLQPRRCQVLEEAGGRGLSDHLPLFAEFTKP